MPTSPTGLTALVIACASLLLSPAAPATPSAQSASPSPAAIRWADLGPLQPQVAAAGTDERSFADYVARLRRTHAERVRAGDLDHLVFYMLQSKSFTALPPIEPALSAKALVDGLREPDRAAFLDGRLLVDAPAPVRARIAALLSALQKPGSDPRRRYFSELLAASAPDPRSYPALLHREYARGMRFIYEKEFVAQRSAAPAQAVADLYRSRGLSTDTAVEAGYLVSIGLGIVKSLDSGRPVRRALIVGPGLDLAPRTALLEVGPPESYQPWAVIDALVARGLSRLDDLQVVAADINPRVVAHLSRARETPPRLELISEIRDDDRVSLSEEFREYFAGLGDRITGGAAKAASLPPIEGHLRRTVPVGPAAARTLTPRALDVVVDRLDEAPFDLIIATNILPYFDDVELAMAMSNITAMLAPGGVFLHNESRPALAGMTAALGLRLEQSRHAVIATVRTAKAPLFDSVWVHRKQAKPGDSHP